MGGGGNDQIFIGILFMWMFIVPYIILNNPIKYMQYDYHFINEKSEPRTLKLLDLLTKVVNARSIGL